MYLLFKFLLGLSNARKAYHKLAAVFCILCSPLGFTKSCAQVLQEKVHISALIKEDPSSANRGFDDFIHFQLYLTDAQRECEVRNALHCFSRLESYRFVSERRRIYFSDALGFVELYSAEELRQSSGRSIRPQNIKDANEAESIFFVFTDQGTIKEQVHSIK